MNDDEKSLASHDEEEEILSKQSKKDNKTSGESSDSKSSKVSNYKIESNFTLFFKWFKTNWNYPVNHKLYNTFLSVELSSLKRYLSSS